MANNLQVVINDKVAHDYPWGYGRVWTKRAQKVAEAIPHGTAVLDLGGGFSPIVQFLSDIDGGETINYHSLDLEGWTCYTGVADFNAPNGAGFPELSTLKANGKWQVMVAQGLLEYINDPVDFFTRIKVYGNHLIFTHRVTGARRIEDMCRAAGWKFVFKKENVVAGHHMYMAHYD